MEKAKKLIEEMVMTKKMIAEDAGVSYSLLNKFENGKYTGITLSKRLAEAAKRRGEKLIEWARQIEAEAA